MNDFERYRRNQRRYALLRAAAAWAGLLLGAAWAVVVFWAALVVLLTLGYR